MRHASAELVVELDALADASASALDRLREGDETGVVELIERRERLLRVLAEWPAEAKTGLMEQARRAVAVDSELTTALRAQQAKVRKELERLTQRRRSLVSYGATRPAGALYLERLT